MLSFLLSNFIRPTRFKVSEIKLVLMQKSRGESELREGERLISSSQGFKSESNKTSKPNNSNQFVLCDQFLFIELRIGCSPVMSALRITSYIFDQSRFISIPICSRCLHRAVIDHLKPKSSLSASSFVLQLAFFLFSE